MTKILLYWNHICILHNFEKKHIKKVQDRLLEQEIELEVKFFGLGYPEHMSEYLTREDAVLPDMIVSADLEVYENKQLFNKLGLLHQTLHWMHLEKDLLTKAVIRKACLLPIVAIPLVCYTTKPMLNDTESIVEVEKGFTFGGINNSAGKTITKSVWQMYGKEKAKELLAKADIYDMPIGAFQSVRIGNNNTALVPSLYALRADNKISFSHLLKEGAFILPSYFTCRENIDEVIGKTVVKELLSQEILENYNQNGNLHICIRNDFDRTKEIKLFNCVSQEFLDELNDEDFYEVYRNSIPTAKSLW